MALKIRRGSNASRITITPVEGELLYTTDTKKIFVGDGSTLGGTQVSGVNVGANKALAFYQSEGQEVSGSTDLTWDETTNTLTVDRGQSVFTNGTTGRAMLTIEHNSSSQASNTISFARSRGSKNVPLVLQSADSLGNIAFNTYPGYGTTYNQSAGISAVVSTTPITGTAFTVNFVSKTGTGPYYVTYSFVAQPSAPTVSRAYIISGNSNADYNGEYRVFSSTTTSMTLYYTTDPGTYGSGTTTAQLATITPATLLLTVQTQNGNVVRAGKLSDAGQLYLGPLSTEFSTRPLDPLANGQLAITTTTVVPTQTLAAAQIALRTYANTTQGGSMNILRGRGTVTSPLGLTSGDQIHLFKFYGLDSPTNIATAATISIDVDNTVSTNKIPTSMTFATANATSGTVTNAVKIDSTQTTTFLGPIKQNNLRIVNVNYVTINATASYTLSSSLSNNVLLVTNTGYTATVTLPTSPVDGQVCSFSIIDNTVTLSVGGLVTVTPSFAGSTTAGTSFTYVYRTSTSTWYRIG
jgi:hypothetical protein